MKAVKKVKADVKGGVMKVKEKAISKAKGIKEEKKKQFLVISGNLRYLAEAFKETEGVLRFTVGILRKEMKKRGGKFYKEYNAHMLKALKAVVEKTKTRIPRHPPAPAFKKRVDALVEAIRSTKDRRDNICKRVDRQLMINIKVAEMMLKLLNTDGFIAFASLVAGGGIGGGTAATGAGAAAAPGTAGVSAGTTGVSLIATREALPPAIKILKQADKTFAKICAQVDKI